jgi:hypothetical protein
MISWGFVTKLGVQEKEGVEIKPGRKRRSPEQIAQTHFRVHGDLCSCLFIAPKSIAMAASIVLLLCSSVFADGLLV